MGYHFILEKMDEALKTFVEASRGHELEGVQIAKGFDVDELTPPCIGIVSTAAAPMEGMEDSGNWRVTTKITLRSVKTAGVEAHRGLASALFDLLHASSLAEDLQNVDELTVMVCTILGAERRLDGNDFVSEETWEFEVAPSRPTEGE